MFSHNETERQISLKLLINFEVPAPIVRIYTESDSMSRHRTLQGQSTWGHLGKSQRKIALSEVTNKY